MYVDTYLAFVVVAKRAAVCTAVNMHPTNMPTNLLPWTPGWSFNKAGSRPPA